jgi:hypothetical protein
MRFRDPELCGSRGAFEIATHSVIVEGMSSIGNGFEDSELLDGLLLIATTMRCDSQNFYEERMEVSRRNWNPRDFEVSRSGCIK